MPQRRYQKRDDASRFVLFSVFLSLRPYFMPALPPGSWNQSEDNFDVQDGTCQRIPMPKPFMCREERLKDLPSIFAASAKSGSELSQVHIMIKEAAAANPGEKVESFGYLKAAQYAVDRYIFE